MKKILSIISLAVLTIGLLGSCKKDNGPETPKLPDGALPGEFSVSATKKVHFSKGNLWADGSNALHFESNQYSSASSWDASHVSHFTWSSTVEAAVGGSNSGDYLFCDESHKVSVDGGEAIYYALSNDEWVYLFNTRTASTVSGTANARYAKATVNSKAGVILLPDTYAHPEGVIALTSINTADAAFTGITYDSTNWAKMESAGAVFLPVAGHRDGFSVEVNDRGYYWSSTPNESLIAFLTDFSSRGVSPGNVAIRYNGHSVRLVTEVK